MTPGCSPRGSLRERVIVANIPFRAGRWLARGRVAQLMWAFAVAEALAATRRHFAGIDPKARRRVVELVRKSKGRPSNLTSREKQELRRLVGEMDLWSLSKELAATATSGRKKPR
jgi:hypothetical protein